MPFPKIKLSDDSGNAVGVTDNRLNVNAYLAATPTIDIGDVSLLLDGTAADYGTGNVNTSGRTLRVTIATDDNVSTKLTTINTNIATIDSMIGVHDVSTGTGGSRIMGVSRLIDGSPLPTVDAEGDNTQLYCSLNGIQFVNLTTENGSDSAVVADDSGQQATPGMVNVGGEYRSSDTTYTDGDATILQTNVNGLLRVDGSDVTQPISGTVTANLGTTDNAVLDAIAASLALLDNSIASGSELQVDVVASLPAGTNAIGKLSANSGVDIGDVDITSIVPGTGATNLGKAEDAAHTSGDVGVMPLAVRKDIAGTLAGSSGDYSPLQVNGQGALYIASHAVTNAGTFAVQSTLQAGSAAIGKLAANSGVDIGDVDVTSISAGTNAIGKVGHDITGMTHGYNSDVDATAEQLDGSTSGLDVACKRVDLMAGATNTGIIYVGGSDTIGPLTAGMELRAGDFYSIDIDNLNQIWIEASVANQTLRYLYYT